MRHGSSQANINLRDVHRESSWAKLQRNDPRRPSFKRWLLPLFFALLLFCLCAWAHLCFLLRNTCSRYSEDLTFLQRVVCGESREWLWRTRRRSGWRECWSEREGSHSAVESWGASLREHNNVDVSLEELAALYDYPLDHFKVSISMSTLVVFSISPRAKI